MLRDELCGRMLATFQEMSSASPRTHLRHSVTETPADEEGTRGRGTPVAWIG